MGHWCDRSGCKCGILLSVAIALVGSNPRLAYGQECSRVNCADNASASSNRWNGHLTGLLLNAVLGGLTSSIGQTARGKSLSQGFSSGALGGALVYGGKAVSGQRFAGAGMLGRQASAVGSSIVANAAASRKPLDRVVLPLGVTRFYWHRAHRNSLRLKLDVPATIASIYYARQRDVSLDVDRSFSAGAVVFVRHDFSLSAGKHVLSVIKLRQDSRTTMEASLAHEQVHVLQTDFSFVAWSEPAERWLLSKTRVGRTLGRYADFRLDALVLAGLNGIVPYANRPWEREAFFLSDTKELYSVR